MPGTNRHGMTKDQQKFIDWLVEPAQTRKPKTQVEFAETIHASPSTLTKWKKDQKFREAWDATLYELNISPDRIQDVIDSMWAQACRGNVKAAELYLKYTDRFRDVRTIEHVQSSVEELSDEELEAEYKGFLSEEVDKRIMAEQLAAQADDDD